MVLHLEPGVLHRKVDVDLLDAHKRLTVPFDRLTVDLGDGGDVRCNEKAVEMGEVAAISIIACPGEIGG